MEEEKDVGEDLNGSSKNDNDEDVKPDSEPMAVVDDSELPVNTNAVSQSKLTQQEIDSQLDPVVRQS